MLTWTKMEEVREPPKLFPVVIDLETCDPPEQEIEVEKEFVRAGNLKDPAKIEKKKDEIKLAVTDSAPIWCVGIETPSSFISISQADLTPEETQAAQMMGWMTICVKSETELLAAYHVVLQSMPEHTRLIGAGKFDLNKSRFRFARHGLPVPQELFRFGYSDLMHVWQGFSGDDKLFVSVREMALKLGIPYDLNMEGAEIPQAIVNGEHFAVLIKNRKDCEIEKRIAYRLMSGRFEC